MSDDKNLPVEVAKMQEQIKNLEEKIDTHTLDQKEDFRKTHQLIEKVVTKIDGLPNWIDSKYATKEVVANNKEAIQELKSWKNRLWTTIPAVIVVIIAVFQFFQP